MRIVVLDGYTLNPGDNPWNGVAALGELTVNDRTPSELIVERARGAEILLTNKTPLNAETIKQLKGLKGICVLATGYNIVDIQAARQLNIPVCNVPVYGTDSVAQFVFALLLEICHHVARHDASIRLGKWQSAGDFCFWETSQIELAGKKMGIIGFGRIGRRVGEIAHAMGMEVLANDQIQAASPDYRPFAWKNIEEIAAEADVISLHCPLTTDNQGMINKAFIEQMKPTGILLNAARGQLVNEADLAEALNHGRIAAAALDVLSSEPINEKNPLLHAKNCLLTPHIAWATLSARRRMMNTTLENIKGIQAGSPINMVN